MVYDFYVSYATSIELITLVRMRDQDQPLLVYTLVRRVRVDLCYETICKVLFLPEYVGLDATFKFNYESRVVRRSRMMRVLVRWVARQLTTLSVDALGSKGRKR